MYIALIIYLLSALIMLVLILGNTKENRPEEPVILILFPGLNTVCAAFAIVSIFLKLTHKLKSWKRLK